VDASAGAWDTGYVFRQEAALTYTAPPALTHVQDTRFIKFLLHIGKPRALDLFHRLDKDHGGTLTIKEFVFGVQCTTNKLQRMP